MQSSKFDILSHILAEQKKTNEALVCLQKEFSTLKLDVLERVHSQDKKILSIELKSGVWGTVGAALALVVLKVTGVLTK